MYRRLSTDVPKRMKVQVVTKAEFQPCAGKYYIWIRLPLLNTMTNQSQYRGNLMDGAGSVAQRDVRRGAVRTVTVTVTRLDANRDSHLHFPCLSGQSPSAMPLVCIELCNFKSYRYGKSAFKWIVPFSIATEDTKPSAHSRISRLLSAPMARASLISWMPSHLCSVSRAPSSVAHS